MDIQIVSQLICTVGFPIVACGAMFWKVNDQDKRHQDEMDALKVAIENNTNAITALTEHIKARE